MRAHYRAPVQNNQGALQAGTVVSIYVNGTTNPPSGAGTLLSQALYSDGSSLATLANPFTTPDGNISFYLATPQRVDLGLQPPGGQLVIYPDIDVEESAVSSIVLTFPGSAASSTQMGSNATANQLESVALGDTASATGQQSTAAGQQASASGANSTAYGQDASASGTGGVAVGQASVASGPGSLAVGYGANAAGLNSTAIGTGAAAAGAGSTAIGDGAQAPNANQVVLGTAAADVVLPGGLVAGQNVAQALSNGSVITYAGTLSVPVSAVGAVTGLILAIAGAQGGQLLIISNESAFTLTFAAAGTSNVADGVSDVIAALSGKMYIYDGNTSLWYPVL